MSVITLSILLHFVHLVCQLVCQISVVVSRPFFPIWNIHHYLTHAI